MKDIVISQKSVRRELWILLACFIFAVLFDLFGIIKYQKPFYEVFQTIGYEIVITAIVYAIVAILRLLVWLVLKPFKKK